MASPAAPTVLVVDDDDDNRELLARRLEREGFQVARAAGGHEGLARVAQGGVDLVLLDVMMPELSGLEVLAALRRDHSAAHLPVIMVTAKGESDDVVEALGLGANDYVTKPVDFAVAVARVRAQLRVSGAAPHPEDVGPRDIQAGMVLGGRYRLEARLGSGTFGTVYRARHTDLDQPVAVKVLHVSTQGSPESLIRFRREGVTAVRVKHPNAVSVFDFGVTPGGVAYLVMELLAGYPLEDELKGAPQLPVARCARVLSPVCQALAVAHRAGVVHRDIKPANIFLHQAGGAEVPKVLDFGIAQIAGHAVGQRVTLEGWIVGTPAYMAPERFAHVPVDGKADVYSVGVVLFQMLTGRLPFEADPADPIAIAARHATQPPPALRALRPDVSAAVEALLLQALAKRPEDRPGAGALAAALGAATS
jgi:CheY-like chemotaxis protein